MWKECERYVKKSYLSHSVSHALAEKKDRKTTKWMLHKILASYLAIDFICTTTAEYNRIQENTGHETIFTVYFYLLEL